MEVTSLPKQWISVQGVSTFYYEAGEGPEVLLLHGIATNARDWLRVMRELSQTHRVIAPALPGFGETSPIADVRPASLASFMASFLDELGVNESVVIGHSLGGLIAGELALSHPQRVTRLVLADSAGLGRAVHPGMIGLSLIPRPLAEVLITGLQLPGGSLLLTLLSGLLLRQPWRIPLRTWMDQMLLTSSRIPMRTTLAMLSAGISLTGQRPDVLISDRLPRIQAPTLVIWGLYDQLVPVCQAWTAVHRLPKARLAIIANSGHIPFLDNPVEFLDLISPFVRDDITKI